MGFILAKITNTFLFQIMANLGSSAMKIFDNLGL